MAAVGLLLYIRLFRNPDGSGMLVNRAAKAAAQGAELEAQDAKSEEQGEALGDLEAEAEDPASDEPDAPLPDEAPESDEVPDNEAADPDAETKEL